MEKYDPKLEKSYEAAAEDLARSFILEESDAKGAKSLRSSASVYALLAIADELKTANLQSYYATTGTSVYSERQRTELTGRLGIPETPIVPLNREHETTQSLGGLPTKAEVEAEIEACAADLWKADPGNNTPARTFSEDYASAQDRYRAMARAALGLNDEPKDKK